VVLIRTDVSEDRIASIFRVNEYEQVQSETVSSCIDGDSRKVLVHPEDGGDTILRNVGSYKSHTASSPRR
jgi:hypothetical protein